MRELPAWTVSMLAVYQAAIALLCLSVPTSSLVQDFARAASSIPLSTEQAAEPSGLSTPHPNVPLLQFVDEGPMQGSVWGPWYWEFA